MSLTLSVDGDRWRAHLRAFAEATPGLVPVAKGNGYGFGVGRLARRAEWLGVPTLAVGTYEELPEVEKRYDGDLLVLTPWRPFGAAVEAELLPGLLDLLGAGPWAGPRRRGIAGHDPRDHEREHDDAQDDQRGERQPPDDEPRHAADVSS